MALEYDVGVYFEANGHGTVLFSSSALAAIATANPSEYSPPPPSHLLSPPPTPQNHPKS
jgi:hypothetical protein